MNRKVTIQLLEWVKAVIIALVIALTLRTLVFEVVRVEGPSMQDTLHTGQRVYIEKLLFRLTGPKRGDIVECYFGSDREKTYIKRVIGLPGEELVIQDGKIYINGYLYDDPWFDEYVYQVVVDKKYLTDEQRAALEADPIVLAPWDPMGSLARSW